MSHLRGVDFKFIKIFQNTPQLCWGDEWSTLSPGGEGLPRGVIKNTPQGKGEGEMI
jgi:hypothetical protein